MKIELDFGECENCIADVPKLQELLNDPYTEAITIRLVKGINGCVHLLKFERGEDI